MQSRAQGERILRSARARVCSQWRMCMHALMLSLLLDPIIAAWWAREDSVGRGACVRASLRAPCLSGYHRLRGGGGGDGVEIDLLDDDNGLGASGEDQGGDSLILEDRTAEESLASLVHGVEYDVCARELVCVCVCVCVLVCVCVCSCLFSMVLNM